MNRNKWLKQSDLIDINKLQQIAKTLRYFTLDMIFKAQVGHIGGSLSLAEIMASLYFCVLKINPEKPDWSNRDRLLVSKGHCAPIYYAALAERGFFPLKVLKTFGKASSILQGHPDICTPGVDMPSGSLGMGLSVGVGIALGAKLKKKTFRTFVLMGDGELQCGQVWEAAMAAAKFKLGNLTVIVDNNHLQQTGFIKDVMPIEPLAKKWQAFNWKVFEINGHNIQQILKTLRSCLVIKKSPTVIIAKTIKGKGVSFMENSTAWHNRIPTRYEYERAIREIDNG